MVRLLGFVFLIALVALGLSFAVLNADPVTLNYYFGFLEVPLSMIVVVSLVTGALIGVLVSMGSLLRLRQTSARLKRQLHTAQRDADRVTILPARD